MNKKTTKKKQGILMCVPDQTITYQKKQTAIEEVHLPTKIVGKHFIIIIKYNCNCVWFSQIKKRVLTSI